MGIDTLIYLVSDVKALKKCVNGKLSTGGVAKQRERESIIGKYKLIASFIK